MIVKSLLELSFVTVAICCFSKSAAREEERVVFRQKPKFPSSHYYPDCLLVHLTSYLTVQGCTDGSTKISNPLSCMPKICENIFMSYIFHRGVTLWHRTNVALLRPLLDLLYFLFIYSLVFLSYFVSC